MTGVFVSCGPPLQQLHAVSITIGRCAAWCAEHGSLLLAVIIITHKEISFNDLSRAV